MKALRIYLAEALPGYSFFGAAWAHPRFEYLIVYNLPDALAEIQAHELDLIIVDYAIREALTEIRKIYLGPLIAIGYETQSNLAENCDYYISKPLDRGWLRDFVSVLYEVWAKRESKQDILAWFAQDCPGIDSVTT